MKQFDYLKIAEAIFAVTKAEKNQDVLNGMHKVVNAVAYQLQALDPKLNTDVFEYACFTGRYP